MFWSRFSVPHFLALQCCCIFYSCNSEEEDLWGYWGVETAYHLSCGKQSLFPSTDTKFQVKCRMKGGWVQAEDLYVIIIFFENIVESILENPWNLAENPLENPGKEFNFTVGHPVYPLRDLDSHHKDFSKFFILISVNQYYLLLVSHNLKFFNSVYFWLVIFEMPYG